MKADGTDVMGQAMGHGSNYPLDAHHDVRAKSDSESSLDGDEMPIISGEESDGLDSDWDARRLCPDESCIGVIGPDGLCKECGRPGQGSSWSFLPSWN